MLHFFSPGYTTPHQHTHRYQGLKKKKMSKCTNCPCFLVWIFFFLLTVLFWSTFFFFFWFFLFLYYLQGFVSFSAFLLPNSVSLLLSTFICKSAPFPSIVKLLFIPFHYPVTVFSCFFLDSTLKFLFQICLVVLFSFPSWYTATRSRGAFVD